MQLTLLGTGNPRPNPLRAGPSQHLQLGDTSVLVDCGNGAARRMVEAGLDPKDIDLLFLTHQHSDHTIDLAHMLIVGWTMGREKPLTVVGPLGTAEFVQRVLHAFEFDIKARRFADRTPPEAMDVPVREVSHGDVIEGDGWCATAIEVDHIVVKPALGFRFEEDRQSIVVSGDTAPCQALIEAAAGVDLLVHELNGATPDRDPHSPAAQRLSDWDKLRNASHTCAHQVGAVAVQAGVPRLVLSHLPPSVDEAWVRDTVRPDYRGELVIGHDLMRFPD